MDEDSTSSGKRQKMDGDASPTIKPGTSAEVHSLSCFKPLIQTLSMTGMAFPSAPSASSSQTPGLPPTSLSDGPSWPPARLPVELFYLIASSLPRRDIQNMRLVNQEFEDKLAGWYFRNVVATFRPDIYGYLNDVDVPAATRRQKQSAIHNGLRVFEQFGRRIKAFALSLELNASELLDPPSKLSQEVVKTSWGLYRWPVENYARYSDLEDIEESADETPQMTEAFGQLTKLMELGLSCDAGLGFLSAPVTHQTRSRVFESSRYDPEPIGEHAQAAQEADYGRSSRYINLKRMVVKAGFVESETHGAIELLLECEGRNLGWVEDGPSAPAAEDTPFPSEAFLGGGVVGGPSWRRNQSPTRVLNVANRAGRQGGEVASGRRSLEPRNLTVPQKEMLLEMKWAVDALVQSYVISVIDNKDIFSKVTVLCLARIPSSLLHILAREDLWRALETIAKLRLGVVPDWRSVAKPRDGIMEEERVSPLQAFPHVFGLLKTHVSPLANLKSLHFEWLCGGESGDGLGQRNRYILPAPFTAAADWMTDRNPPTSEHLLLLPHIQQLSLKNCWFTPHVFLRVVGQMVNSSLTELQLESVSLTGPPSTVPRELILARRNSETGHWPWPMCTGPVTPGLMFNHPPPTGANIHIPNGGPPAAAAGIAAAQAAPVLGNQQVHQMMGQNIVGGQAGGALDPLNIIALNLQNTGNPMFAALAATAAPASSAADGTHPVAFAGEGLAPHVVVQPSVSAFLGISHGPPAPRFLNWAHVINELTPRRSILEQYEGMVTEQQKEYFRQQLDQKLVAAGVRPRGVGKRLKKLDFTSCGYALVDQTTLDNWQILPSHPIRANFAHDICDQLTQLDKSVMTCSDPLLARIVDYIPDDEKHILRNTFGLFIPGYATRYDSSQVDRGQYRDGFILHGVGRFRGVIDRDAS